MYNKLLIFVDKKDAILMQHISESLLNLGAYEKKSVKNR